MPISVVMMRAISSHPASSASAAAFIHRARSAKDVSRYSAAVAAARAIRSSTSASESAAKVFSISPVAGFVVAIAMRPCTTPTLLGRRRGAERRFGCQDGRVSETPSDHVRSPFASNPFVAEVEPIIETDAEIRAALEEAEVPPLLPALAYLTGDLSLLRPHLRPDPILLAMPQGGLTDDQLREARDLALETLVRFRDTGCVPAPPPSDADLLQIMEFAVGGGADVDMAAYLPLLEEELAVRGEDRRAPGWHKADVAPDADFRVVIIGAGMSGLLAGHRLQQAGVPFVIFEKDDDVGGTWLENTYPGCRVDNPNHNYSYSFAQRHDWPLHFSTQDVLLDYFRRCADAFGLRDDVQFGTQVRSATWSEADTAVDRAWCDTATDTSRSSRRTPSSARSASSTARCSPTSRAATRSRDRRSTRPAGTTTSICAASASR